MIVIRRNLHVEPVVLTSQFFESFAFRFGDEERKENTDQPGCQKWLRGWGVHEQGKDFHNVVQPSVGTASVSQGADQSLRNDSADFTGSGAHTMGGGTIPGGEDFTRHDESRSIGTEILEEVAEAIKSEESPR